MHALRFAALAAALLMIGAPAPAQGPSPADGEAELREQLSHALWPGDIVRLADEYTARFPAGPAAPQAAEWRQRAAETQRLLARREVWLHRAAFQPAQAGDDRAADLRLAALGDRAASLRLARRSLASDDGASAPHRYVGWLQYASLLGDERASYELALHFRRQSQPVLASQYENLALAQGYQPPAALDNLRK